MMCPMFEPMSMEEYRIRSEQLLADLEKAHEDFLERYRRETDPNDHLGAVRE